MDIFCEYSVYKIVDELTISPLIRNSEGSGRDTGAFAILRYGKYGFILSFYFV